MNQEVAVAFAAAMALFACGAVWPAAMLGGRLDENANRIKQCRAMLQEEAVAALQSIRVRLLKIASEVGGASGLNAIKVAPDSMLEPVSKYVELVKLDDVVEHIPAQLQFRSRLVFGSSLLVAGSAVFGLYVALFRFGQDPALVAWVLGGVLSLAVLLGGGSSMLVLIAKRRLDRAFMRANRFETTRATDQGADLDWGDV